jgi:hypothetical protein
MSTKGTLKHYWDDAGKAGFHLYQECFDFENEFVYLELTGRVAKDFFHSRGVAVHQRQSMSMQDICCRIATEKRCS